MSVIVPVARPRRVPADGDDSTSEKVSVPCARVAALIVTTTLAVDDSGAEAHLLRRDRDVIGWGRGSPVDGVHEDVRRETVGVVQRDRHVDLHDVRRRPGLGLVHADVADRERRLQLRGLDDVRGGRRRGAPRKGRAERELRRVGRGGPGLPGGRNRDRLRDASPGENEIEPETAVYCAGLVAVPSVVWYETLTGACGCDSIEIVQASGAPCSRSHNSHARRRGRRR